MLLFEVKYISFLFFRGLADPGADEGRERVELVVVNLWWTFPGYEIIQAFDAWQELPLL